jgi:hypothetical protein
MKVLWINGGLHAEPELPGEAEALRVLWKSARRTSMGGLSKAETHS